MSGSTRKGPTLPFNMPYISGMTYAPGHQINSPGNSALPYGGFPASFFHAIPWPNAVPTIRALANFSGIARDYPVGIVNNANATLPSQFFFIGGTVGKSKG